MAVSINFALKSYYSFHEHQDQWHSFFEAILSQIDVVNRTRFCWVKSNSRRPRVPTRPGKPGKMRVHLEISWNFEKFNKYHGKMTWHLEKLGGYWKFTFDSLETIQNSLNYWSRKEGLLIWSIIEMINFLFKWNSISLHIYIQNQILNHTLKIMEKIPGNLLKKPGKIMEIWNFVKSEKVGTLKTCPRGMFQIQWSPLTTISVPTYSRLQRAKILSAEKWSNSLLTSWFYWPQGKVMFSETSVSHSVHRRGEVGQTPSWRQTPQTHHPDADPR